MATYGARWVVDHLSEMACWHWDVQLLKLLRNHPEAPASFIFPAIGHYCTHESGILRGAGPMDRPSSWNGWWLQEGVEPQPGTIDRPREVWCWTGVDHETQILAQLEFSDAIYPERLNWLTHFVMDEEYASREAHRSRLSETSAGAPRAPLTQEQMREMFDVSRMHNVTEAKHGTRADRANRQQKTLAKFRWFTEDEQLAFKRVEAILRSPPSPICCGNGGAFKMHDF